MSEGRPPLADTHCHLILPAFTQDREAALERARAAGIRRFLVPGIDLETSRQAVELAGRQTDVYAAVGIHPHHAEAWDAAAAGLRELAAAPRVVAIGEIGLDYYRDLSPRPTQLRAFEGQLALAAELGLPVVIHNRRADDDLLAVLEAWAARLPVERAGRPGVLHAFSGGAELAGRGLAAGFLLGVGGPITYRNGRSASALRAVPAERLLLETDAPYLPPHPLRGQRNEPAHLTYIAAALADLQDLPLDTLAAATSTAAARLFGWDHGLNDHHLF